VPGKAGFPLRQTSGFLPGISFRRYGPFWEVKADCSGKSSPVGKRVGFFDAKNLLPGLYSKFILLLFIGFVCYAVCYV
jgi:hypothetical protein